MTPSPTPHIAIIGAGPIGIEAALAAADHSLPFTLYEAAPEIAGHIRSWSHVRLFTPWSLNVSPRMAAHLEAAGLPVPGRSPAEASHCPTGGELIDQLLEPLTGLPELSGAIRTGTTIRAVGRQGMVKSDAIGSKRRGQGPFRLLLADLEGTEGIELADVVIDTSGSLSQPNSLGDGGIAAPGERALGDRIVRTIPDLERDADDWAGRTTLVVGAGHSAQTAVGRLADLAEAAPGTEVLWAFRGDGEGFTAEPDDPLPERSALTRRAAELAAGAIPVVHALPGSVVESLSTDGDRIVVRLRRGSDLEAITVDRLLALTGAVGDHSLYRQLQVHECYATSGPMKLAAALLGEGSSDCLAQTSHGSDTLVNPEPDFFILGSKSYGRNNTFLMRVGWEQVEEVFSLLASRAEERTSR